MSAKPPICVQSSHLTERPDGQRTLAISSKTGEFEFDFSPEEWQRLADNAKWFYNHVTMITPKENE